MSKLEELGQLEDEAQIEIPEEVPEESTGFVPLVQPGIYIFKLPDDLSSKQTTKVREYQLGLLATTRLS